MPAVELLLARQGTGKRTILTGSLPVTFSTGATSFTSLAEALVYDGSGHTLTVPFVPFMFLVDNSDNANDLLVKCTTGASVLVPALGSAQLFSDGDKITNIGADATKVKTVSATTYTLLATDAGATLIFTSASAVTLTVPAGLPTTFQCALIQAGAGAVTPTASSTTLHNRQSFTVTAGQWAIASIIAYAADSYVLAGDLA